MMTNPLFAFNKLEYAQGNKPNIDCILCGIIRQDERVKCLEVFRTDNFIITVNLYPYNPGHLMIIPRVHITDIRQMAMEIVPEMDRLQRLSLDILEELYQPHGYNVGYNVGHAGGASIDHLHLHIVPRFHNEPGIIDILSGSRVIVEDPLVTRDRVRQIFEKKKREGKI